ncbi:hybrid sensor histidine kinase/response regulator [Bradyrhizobium sp. CCBAU 051011]|jgi:two-component system, sensor histidine kinase|uniref:ATP-binding protein n=1 Tax=Bradyrhizobium sp. CCBAU 051011 TaxID=858422 RepID=UPI001373C513|nr:ATP-binding protein [Bradyrhizobium sp. CCBAU 051011]QHO72121.1 hybrid sensor histidine kinase/response regulator [Bradyrhizobium sp. CCBAU 051011]
MAAKRRSPGTTGTIKKRRAKKKRGSSAAAKTRATRKSTAPGMVEAALAAFAHEVRTPLTGILAISNLLATSELDERERRWVDTIKAGAEHLASLATLFVDAARSGGPGLTVRQDFFDLRTLARNAGDSLTGRAAAKGLQSSVVISEELPGFAIGDSVRLRAAVENLIDNAVKFTEQGSVALQVTPVRASKGRVAVSFAVSDSGIGLTLSEIKRLFRPFSQANVSIASRFGGAGLGLSSVRQLARAMGGDVTVTQRRGGGTTFTLNVVMSSAEDTMAAASGPNGEAPIDSPRPLRLLSVEDNPFGRVVLNSILTELGHQAEFIGQGEAAPERLAQGAFDAVLMDMVLPGIDGVEAIRRIRALSAPLGRIPIIGISGRGEDEAASRAAGADIFLVKPVSPRALATALHEATSPSAIATS